MLMKIRHMLMVLPVTGLAIFTTACTNNTSNANGNTNTFTPTTLINTNTAAENTNTAANLNANQNTNTANTNTAALTQAVSIAGMAFTPQDLLVKVGTKITWTNNDGFAHHVLGNNGGPDSGILAAGASYSYTYTTVGSFPYHCSIHPSMTGSVTMTN